jgi:hypothetical protein
VAPNSLYPAFVRLDYHSIWGAHVAIIPTRQWFPTSITGVLGSFENWASVPIDAEVMINELVDVLVPFHLTTTIFDTATVYTMASPTAPAIPQNAAALGQVGTTTNTSHAKATQNCFVFRSTTNGKLKIYLLDAPTIGGAFAKVLPGAWNSVMLDLFTTLALPNNAWAARDGGKPNNAMSCTSTLNEKLRKEYGMA